MQLIIMGKSRSTFSDINFFRQELVFRVILEDINKTITVVFTCGTQNWSTFKTGNNINNINIGSLEILWSLQFA